MVNDKEWDRGYPSWGDIGKRVEILLANGQIIEGTLTCEDWADDGEGEEFPIFGVDTGTETISFTDHEEWRFK